MRFLTRAAVSAAAVAVAAATASVVPAQAAGGGWGYAQSPSLQIDESFFMHKHVKGHPGNWHLLQLSVQQDDDGVIGGIQDYRCPRGEAPAPNRDDDCTQVGGFQFVDELGLTVKWSPRLRQVHVYGDIVLEDYFDTGDLTNTTMNVRLYAAGRFHRTVTYAAPTGTDPMEYKTVDIRRGGKITAEGHLAWLKATKAAVKDTEPLHVYWIKGRIPPA